MLALTSRVAAAQAPTPLAGEQVKRYHEAEALFASGRKAEAVALWGVLYKELPPSRAFKLAYNLGVGQLDLRDITAAAEYFQTFLVELEAHKARGELTDDDLKELEALAASAKKEMATLQVTRGRIQVNAAAVAVVAKVGGAAPRIAGFTAWLSPGTYDVVFGDGTPRKETKSITVAAGELVEVTPTPPPPQAAAYKEVVTVATKRPFSPVFIYAAGALTAGAVTTAIYGYARYRHFEDLKNARVDSTHDDEIASGAGTSRTLANGGLATSIVLGTVTAGLVTYYFVRSKDVRETKRVPLPFVAPTPNGAMAGVSVTF